MDLSTGILLGFLIVYGIVMYVISPKTVLVGGFFRGEDRQGRDANPWMITASIFIAWIFAKSVTNAANMGASFASSAAIGLRGVLAVHTPDGLGLVPFAPQVSVRRAW